MQLRKKQNNTSEEVRRVLLAALVSALNDAKEPEKDKKKGLTGVRAVATGAVLYTAGKAAVNGGRFVRERVAGDAKPDAEEEQYDEEEYDDEPEAEVDEEEYDEPEAEADEDEEYEEPEAEGDEDEEYEEADEEYDEPEAEADEDEEYDEEEPEEPEAEADEDEQEEPEEPEAEAAEDEQEEEPKPKRRRPRRPRGSAADQPSLDLPARPSRSRAPVRT